MGKVVAIRADLPNVDHILKQLESMERGALPYTQEAVKASTELVQRTWINFISGHTVTYSGGTFRVRVVSGEYRRSVVEGLAYPALGDKLTGEVSSLSPHGRMIEEGIQPFDMKQTHLNSSKAQVGKDGKKFITVPFRHNTPGATAIGDAMPKQVYDRVKTLAISRRNGLLKHWWTGKATDWGDRLTKSQGGDKEKPHWSAGRYAGMVKMNGASQSTYVTFRRLSENSKAEAWQHPGVEARPVTQAVREAIEKDVIELVRTGFEVDLASLGF